MKRMVALLLALSTFALVLTACSTPSASNDDASSDTNKATVSESPEKEESDVPVEEPDAPSEEPGTITDAGSHESRTTGIQTMFDHLSVFLNGDFSRLTSTLPAEALENLSVDEETLYSDPRYEAAHLLHCESANLDLNPIIYGEDITIEYQLQSCTEGTDAYLASITTTLKQNFDLTAEDACAVKYLYIRRGNNSSVYNDGQAYVVKIDGAWYIYSTAGFLTEMYMTQLIASA